MNRPVILIVSGVAVAAIAITLALTLGKKGGGGDDSSPGTSPDPGLSSTRLPADWPLHFCSTNVQKNFPTAQAVPNVEAITKAGGSVTTMAHPDSETAQLRVIRLPVKLHAKPEAARVLAESGAIQDGDVIVVFRKEWAQANPYGNLQLGQGHAALTTIVKDEKGKIVQTVESPLSYSSHLDHPGHYGGHKTFQILRPNLTESQKSNVAKWARRVLEKQEVQFQADYGAPYFTRFQGKDANSLLIDLAMSTLYGEGEAPAVFCSELIWAFLGLRNVDPDEALSRFPAGGDGKGGARQFIASNAKPIFEPMPGVTKDPMASPGLMQGPDVVLRTVFAGDDAKRRDFLVNTVLAPRNPKPSELDGLMSSGHQQTAIAFQPKIDQLRQWYAEQKEAASAIPALNAGINPNYSPTSFSILANSDAKGANGKLIHYVGTVTFQ